MNCFDNVMNMQCINVYSNCIAFFLILSFLLSFLISSVGVYV